MYAAPYGYQGSPNPGQFIPNPSPNANASPGHGVPSLSHSQQQQPHGLHPHIQQQQPGQHMMFNTQQQYAGSQYTQGQGGGIPGAMGMMQQNSGMAAGPHASPYQTPYSSSGYVPNMPTSTAGLPPNFMPTTGAPSYQMQTPNINLQMQAQAQRMQPPPTSSTPNSQSGGPRGSPFAGAQHNTPPHSTPALQQFSTPQALSQTQSSNTMQAQAGMILTPQTPNFPPGAQGMAGSSMATPLSPGSELREKDRVTVLLDINKFLLMEVMRLQAVQAEAKKEDPAANPTSDATDKAKADKEKTRMERAKRDYFECMKRLQGNLAYLAAIADRSHKPSSQIPPHPSIMTAPPLSPRTPQPSPTSPSKTNTVKKEETEEYKPEGLEDDHGESLKEQYAKLQALFPGVDSKKAEQMAAQAARAQASRQQQGAGGQGQTTAGGGASGGVDHTAQQKMQNDLMRQKMMQAQQLQAQQLQAQQQQGGGSTKSER